MLQEMDVKAGGGQVMTIGEMLRAFLTKLEWFSTLFPRIPVPIQVIHCLYYIVVETLSRIGYLLYAGISQHST